MEIEERYPEILSKEKDNINNTNHLSNDESIPMPGKGKKILFISTNQTRMVRSFIDDGSTTSLCTKEYVKENNLKIYKTIIPMNFSGIFSNIKKEESEIVLITLKLNDCSLLFPVYVVERLPHNADILIGLDQIGKTIGIHIPIEKLGKKPTLSLINSKNKEVVLELKEDDAGKTLFNEVPDLASEDKEDGKKTINQRKIKLLPGGKDTDLETKAYYSINLVDDIKLKENVMSSAEKRKSVQEVTFPHSLRGVVLNQIAYLNEETNIPEENSNVEKVTQHISLITSLEISSIEKAIELLNIELNEVIKLEKELESLKGNHVRKSKKLLRKKLDTYKDQQQILILINDLKKEIIKMNKKRRKKICSIRKNFQRKERKINDNELKKTLSVMKRYTLDEKKSPSANIASSPEMPKITENISHISLLEGLVDTKDKKSQEYLEAIKRLKTRGFDITKFDNKEAPTLLHNEFITTTNITARKKEENVNISPHTTAIWNDKLDKAEIQAFVYHTLNIEQESKKNRLLKSYPSVLVEDESQIKYCNATARGEKVLFDVELEDWYLKDHGDKQGKKPKPYPMKKPMRDLLRATNEEMYRAGVGLNNPLLFEPDFVTPSFFAKVKERYRLVHDYKEVNRITKDMHYPLPRTDYIYECMANKKYFSVLDLKSGYYQFPITQRASKLLATITPEGIWKWNGIPFGPKNGPPFFQKVMERILKDGLGVYVLVYIDDIVVFSDTFDDHFDHLHMVLNALKESNLQANINKCKFFLKQFKLLGKIVTQDGIAPDPSLIQSMIDYPRPKNRNQVRSFLALLNYYREHIQDFGPLTAPLAELNKDNLIWNANTWKDYHEVCFKKLKSLMLEAPILAYPDMNKTFHLQTDASLFGAGAVLFQYDEKNHKKVVSYASWLFNDQQRKYSTTERELFAIILALRKWKPFLGYTKFMAETDHEALTGYMKLNDPHGKIARWIVELNQFNFEIKYIKGVLNIPADALSRCQDKNDSIEVISALETHEFVSFMSNDQKYVRTSKVLSRYFEDHIMESSLQLDSEDLKCENIYSGTINYSLPTDTEWAVAQREDPDLNMYIRYIQSKELPDSNEIALEVLKKGKNYFINDKEGILFHQSKDGMLKKCVPKQFRQLLLEEYHDSMWSGGHLGRDKTINKIKENFYFRNLHSYVDLWVSSCSQCRSVKRNNGRANIPEGNIAATRPWQLVSIDLWSSKVMSTSGNLYTLTVIDAFSKHAHAIPIPNKEAATVAQALIDRVFCVFGYPERLHSDRGTEFINDTLKEICKLAGTIKTATTAYHPQGNGYVERIHQFFRNALTCYIRYDQRDWDEVLPHIMLIYNTTVHSALKDYTPSQVMFGRTLQLATVSGTHINELELGASAYTNRLKIALSRVQNEVLDVFRTKNSRTAIRNLNAFRKKKFVTYQVGELVGLRVEKVSDEFRSNKLFPRFQGPYKITRVTQDSKVIYLEDPYGVNVEVPVTANRLIRWVDRGILNDIDKEEEEVLIDEEVFGREAFPSTNPIPEDKGGEIFLSTSKEKDEEFFIEPEVKGDEIFLPLPANGEDVLQQEIPNFNSKFNINDRVRVQFDNGKYYYGNITKFIDNIKRVVHFDDGDIIDDIKEDELIRVNQRLPTDGNNLKLTTRLNGKNRGDKLHKLENEGFEIYYLSVHQEFC
jgi:transposase InsO family protein